MYGVVAFYRQLGKFNKKLEGTVSQDFKTYFQAFNIEWIV